MEELLKIEQNLRLNPYVTQADKLSDSMLSLVQTLERKGTSYGFARSQGCKEQVEDVTKQLEGELCSICKGYGECSTIQGGKLRDMVQELIEDIEEYGVELSVSNKRLFHKRCSQFLELKDKVEKNLWLMKHNHVWEERIQQSQQASFVMVQALLKSLNDTTREIDASVFRDERLERKISNNLKKMGVRPLKIMIFVSEAGVYEVHISAKAKAGVCVTMKEMASVISQNLGRRVHPEEKEGFVLREGYNTVVFVEQVRYQTLWGVAKKTKEGSECSGDNFLISEQGGGKKCVLLSDGMGSGSAASKQSQLVLEMGEGLLESGVAPREAIQIMNAFLSSNTKEVEFATLDLGVIDTYRGVFDLYKAGASSTYVVSNDHTQCYEASSLPIGVVCEMECNHFQCYIKSDCYIIMLTDGVMDGIPMEEREGFIRQTIKEIPTKNPTEIAEVILEKGLNAQGEVAKDDMMVLIIGVWELQF